MKQYSLLLACDLDRTMFPNGPEPFSVEAKVMFENFIKTNNVFLVYVSGRSLQRALMGFSEFCVPKPTMYIGDVGTSLYIRNEDDSYTLHTGWHDELSRSWGSIQGSDIHEKVSGIQDLTQQELNNQNTFKQSYYFIPGMEETIITEVKRRLTDLEVSCEVITHIDQDTNIGYLDIVPSKSSKEHALAYLQEYFSIDKDSVVYAGDSGNDLSVLTSGYKAILVNNATENFKIKVKKVAEEKGTLQNIYFAQGGYGGLNGNYVSGILEGLHYFGYLK